VFAGTLCEDLFGVPCSSYIYHCSNRVVRAQCKKTCGACTWIFLGRFISNIFSCDATFTGNICIFKKEKILNKQIACKNSTEHTRLYKIAFSRRKRSRVLSEQLLLSPLIRKEIIETMCTNFTFIRVLLISLIISRVFLRSVIFFVILFMNDCCGVCKTVVEFESTYFYVSLYTSGFWLVQYFHKQPISCNV